uniref:Consortin-like n=1 Tax=Crassostrea virginica TaxID=6565 RepID=A0A8B8DMG7_CRAVI|nr:consortin-like [Crassostrea virginica]
MMEDEKVNENGKKSTAQIDETPNEDGTQNKNSEKDKEENLSDGNMPRINKIETSETTPVSENNTNLADVRRQPGDGEHEIKEAAPNPGDDVKTNDVVEEDDDEGIDVSDGSGLDGEGRIKLFERGLENEKKGKLKSALKCYMACLRGLKPHSNFPLLPQCLRNVADIFYRQEEYEKAIHFIQAEKIYYESALIDTTDIQKKLEEAQKDQDLPSNVNEDTIRADEFEELAKICLDKNQPQLALEYAGKATKIRQSILGDNHPVTVGSLDFFTQVYAKAGADQYQDNMKRFENQEEMSANESEVQLEVLMSSEKEPQSILRKRKTGERDPEKRVRFDESVVKSEDEEQCAKIFLWILFAICGFVLLILGVYLYCHVSMGSSCASYRHQIKHVWDRLKYYYYHYTQSKLSKFV